ncbi:MAG: acetyl-CoA decarbonylase/synthase complex subunit gamma [Syntrophaceae bacterium PtaU1.Bin231]|nr:MAG: acetyl-CoA decarbonylase/synthase complex subunit gamma [Syntrophaceae bacterium PtaU1.Bin231]
MEYAVDPGLYALGNPGDRSEVFVTANYKMSFDALRSSLPGRDAWILVLDTLGINVWCAAGKGTFGTDELVERIKTSGLTDVVSHRTLILPQLAGPGVAAHEVKKRSGFTVRYGPIKASDLPDYLDAGCRATAAMRSKTFTLWERAVLIPVELVHALKPALLIMAGLFLLGGLGGSDGFWTNALNQGTPAVLAFLAAILGGTVIHPLLLPYLPGRAFTTKGLIIGAVTAVLFVGLAGLDLQTWPGRLGALAWLMFIPAFTAYLAMNYTGCSTFTSLSGVKREMRWALPLEIGMGLGGLTVWVALRFVS